MSLGRFLVALIVYAVLLAVLWLMPHNYVTEIHGGLAFKGVGGPPGVVVTGRDARLGVNDSPDDLVLENVTAYAVWPDGEDNAVLQTTDGRFTLVSRIKSYQWGRAGPTASSLEELAATHRDRPFDALGPVTPLTFWRSAEGIKRLGIAAAATIVLLFLAWQVVRPKAPSPEPVAA